MNATPQKTLAQAQEDALRATATANGDWTRLAYFYWAKGNQAALERLKIERTATDHNLAILLDLAAPKPNPTSLLCQPNLVNKPWILYCLARHWLTVGDLPKAVACAKRSLELVPGHAPAFSLILRYAMDTGQTRLSQSLTTKLLSQCAEQADIRLLTTGLTTSEPTHVNVAPIEIGFYVPVFNAASVLPAVLGGLLHQAYPLHDFVVVDDASTDDSAAIAERYPARLIRHGSNRGLAAARNTAMKSMCSEYVGSCDSDAVLDPDYLIYAAIEIQSAQLPLTVVGGRMTEHYTDGIANLWRSTHLSQDSGLFRKCSGNNEGKPVYLPGCNTVVRRSIVLDFGGYDESHVAVGEDGYMNRLLHRHGFALATTPLARCRHLRRDSPQSVLRTRWNYEWEGHQKMSAFGSVGNLIRVFKIHVTTAEDMARRDQKKEMARLIPMEVLYVYVLFLNSLRHARLTGALAFGQERWFQCELTRCTLCGITDQARRLRDWRDCQIAPLLLPADSPLDPPPPYQATLFRATLADFDAWISRTLPGADLSAISATQ